MNRPPRGGPPRRRGGAGRGRGKTRPFASQSLDVTVESVGARGDGVAHADGTRLYVPGTLAGERVRVTTTGRQGDGVAARLDEVLTPSPDRAAPVCPHFGTCGGCALQHLSADAQAAWKRDRVRNALARRGLDVAVADTVSVPPGTRRRVAWAVAQGRVGFTARASHDVVPVTACPLLVPALNDLLAALPALVGGLSGARQVQATAADNGVDVLLTGPAGLDLGQRQALAAFADERGLARLSWRPDAETEDEPVAQRVPPEVAMGGTPVSFPPGGFLQPSREGEAALTRPVADWLSECRFVADLFAGLGTFALALARTDGVNVHAVESDGAALAVLDRAAGRVGLGGRVGTEARDLFQQPLTAKELDRFDGVVFDPPRAGAQAQAEHLAAARGVGRVAAVSCNPSTLARDLRLLVDGGYRVEKVLPVDQFPFAAHVEAVALLARP